ncbi:MAG TPA: glycosyltransferase family 2 protein [Solirubrobacteraceae bacterium]|nr:glycosyltransferase family 2 protein [Solirubrobacteraceae bacterium]
MLISAVVVTRDERELLTACLQSLAHALAAVDGPTEIVVIDNGSSDGAQAAVRRRFPAVRLIELGENRGFAAGVNEGMRASTGEWLLLLNNDTTIAPDAAAELLAAAGHAPDVGSLAAQLRFARGGAVNSAGFGVDRLGIAFDRHVGEPPDAGGTAVTEVFGACAGAALMRRAMLEDVGGFDESFFMYLDDVDLAWRAQMRGWRCLYVPAAVVHHHHSASSGHGSGFKHEHVGRNRVRLVAKHMPSGELLRYGPAMVVYDAAFVVFAAVTDRTLAPLRGRWSGVRDWRSYRARGRDRRPVALAPVQGLARALARRRGVLGAHAAPERRASRMS